MNSDFYEGRFPPFQRDQRLNNALPCPFCGSALLEMSRMANYVHCLHCGADGPEIQKTSHEEMWRMAVQRWNGRVR